MREYRTPGSARGPSGDRRSYLNALIGYTATTAGDPGIQEWIQSLFTWIPASLEIAAGVLMLKYPITDELMKRISVELETRKAALS